MNLIPVLTPLLAIAFLIERLLEAGFDLLEMIPSVGDTLKKSPEIKQVVSVVVGIILGVIIGNMLAITLFSDLGLTTVDPATDKLLTGAIAGAIAPYAHQLLELLLKLQKFLEAKKTDVETGAQKKQ